MGIIIYLTNNFSQMSISKTIAVVALVSGTQAKSLGPNVLVEHHTTQIQCKEIDGYVKDSKKVSMSLWVISVTLPKVSRDPRMLASSHLLIALPSNSMSSINHLVITWNHSWHQRVNGISMSPLLTSLDLQ